jgi:hypothetical protein
MSDDQWYSTPHGKFKIEETFMLFKSVDEQGKDLVFGPSPQAVWNVTPAFLEAHVLGLKEERSYSATVGGKL